MGWFGSPKAESPLEGELASRIQELSDRIVKLRTEVAGLREERDRTREVTDLEHQIETLKLEKGLLVEENDRKIRETEHKTGLLRTKQQQDVEHATRMAKLEVREGNLTAERERFEANMAFQREQTASEIARVERILEQLMTRLPSIEATMSLVAGQGGRNRGTDAD